MSNKEETSLVEDDINNIIQKIGIIDINKVDNNSPNELDNKDIDNLINNFNNLGVTTEKSKVKGKQCSIEGSNYEKKIHNILLYTKIDGEAFNTQKEEDLAGSGHGNDIECDYKGKKVGIEVKKCKAPDWMQSSIKLVDNKWVPTTKGNKNNKSIEIFEKILSDINLYERKTPPFFEKELTHKEWTKIKEETNIWNDFYKNIPNNTINELYKEKGCYYMQVSDYGLYHLGEDICNFGVPEFTIEQELRIRIKIHTRKDKKGKCRMSVTAACKPKNIKNLEKSKYSLDDVDKLPTNLIYKKTDDA